MLTASVFMRQLLNIPDDAALPEDSHVYPSEGFMRMPVTEDVFLWDRNRDVRCHSFKLLTSSPILARCTTLSLASLHVSSAAISCRSSMSAIFLHLS